MFRFQLVISLFLVLGAGSFLTYGLMHVRASDIEGYEQLIEQSQYGASASLSPPDAHQRRGQVTKEIWMGDGRERLQIRLASSSSDLVLSCHDENPHLVEHMKGVDGYMQEELFYLLPDGKRALPSQEGLYRVEGVAGLLPPKDDWMPRQQIRRLRAEHATFDYTSHQFLAHQVDMIHFEAPGHNLPEGEEELIPLMSGTASAVEFQLVGKRLDFRAHRLKAKLIARENFL